MKRVLLAFGLVVLLITPGCKQPTDSGAGSLTPGDAEEVAVGSETLKMIYANNSTGITFPTLTNDSGTETLTTKFFMGETEVTNAVMAAVYQWAYDNSKFSSTVGDHNGLDATTAKHGTQELLNLGDSDCRVEYNVSGTFSAETGFENNPVTNVTWYGAVMFCNWLTEMKDGNTDSLVYSTIDTSWLDDETTETVTNTGYRLPSNAEWEYTARYRGSDITNTVGGYTNPYYTKGNSASGATAYNGTAAANQVVAVYDYADPDPFNDEQEVKSLGAGSANSLGLYDMSGNVWEWCFNENSTFRAKRGGCWDWNNVYLQIGFVSNDLPTLENPNMGFRLCRTAD